jgi:hypothetical protein
MLGFILMPIIVYIEKIVFVKTRADNSGYANHRVTCLVVMGSPFDSEQVYPELSALVSA